MSEHPISEILKISMNSIREMIDANTIIGEAIKSGDITIIPISKMKCSFAAGGTDQSSISRDSENYPFGGATGGTVNIVPVAFLVLLDDEVKLLHVNDEIHIYEKLIDQFPEVLSSIKETFTNKKTAPTITNLEVIERK